MPIRHLAPDPERADTGVPPDDKRTSGRRPRVPGPVRRGTLSAAGVLAAALALLPGPAMAAGPTPSASSSADSVKLPVISTNPALLTACTKASKTVMTTVPWAQQSLGLARAGQLSLGSGVTVAVIDSGVSTHAPTLSGRVKAIGSAGDDCLGHGTFIAGIIAAAPAAGAGFSGVAPAAHVLAVTGFDATGAPSPAVVASGIRSAVDAKAKVIDISLALPAKTSALTSALAYAADHDVLVVASAVPDSGFVPAGGDTTPARFWPAAEPGVLSVIDVDIAGAQPDGGPRAVRMDLSAPGDAVTGIGPTGKGHYLGSGASVAAAFVAGSAALVRAYHPDLTAAQVAERLVATAYPAPVPRVDPYGAIASVQPARAQPLPSAHSTIHLTAPPGDGGATDRALVVSGAAAVVALGLWGAYALSRRRRRGVRGPAGGL